jgi:hypothetical protein
LRLPISSLCRSRCCSSAPARTLRACSRRRPVLDFDADHPRAIIVLQWIAHLQIRGNWRIVSCGRRGRKSPASTLLHAYPTDRLKVAQRIAPLLRHPESSRCFSGFSRSAESLCNGHSASIGLARPHCWRTHMRRQALLALSLAAGTTLYTAQASASGYYTCGYGGYGYHYAHAPRVYGYSYRGPTFYRSYYPYRVGYYGGFFRPRAWAWRGWGYRGWGHRGWRRW